MTQPPQLSVSFVDVAAAVQIFTLQVSACVVNARDFDPEPIDAPADSPFTTTGRFTLQSKHC